MIHARPRPVLTVSGAAALSLLLASAPASSAVVERAAATPAAIPPVVAAAQASPVAGFTDPPPAEGASVAVEARIADRLETRRADSRLGGHYGLAVIDARTGRLVYGSAENRRFLPASNMKIITATAVLAALGPGHRFTTRVVQGPQPGDLVLVGGGDPMLTTSDLQGLARETAAAVRSAAPEGLRPGAKPRVTVTVDDSLFPEPTRGPGWTGSYMPYNAAPVRALSRLGDYSWDTAANAGKVYAQALRGEGLRVEYAGRGRAPEDATEVAGVRSHTVTDAVRTMLLMSENNVAEVLFRHVGLAESGSATWRAASDATRAVIERLGVPMDRQRLSDGSGLSRSNRVSPLTLARVSALATLGDLPRLAPIYDGQALPVAGRTGTLATAYGRFVTRQSRCARGEVLAKTGSLFDTIALSGIAEAADDRPKAFSFLVNDRPTSVAMLSTRQSLDGLAATVVGCW